MRIPISQISNWKWNARTRNEDQIKFEELCENIKRNGQINAITVIPDGKKFKCIAGRRRLAAFKKLGLDTIQAYVNTELAEDLDIKLITASENSIRVMPHGTEEAYAWLNLYETGGYTAEQAIQGTKWMHNHKDEVDTILGNSSRSSASNKREYGGQRMDDAFKPDKQFIEIAKKISKAPNTQYQYLQWVLQLDRKILEFADKKDLSSAKKTMITTKPLRDHPRLQKELIDEIRDYSDETAQVRIDQVCHDLDTGVIERLEDGTYIIHDGKEHEKISRKGKVLKPPNVRLLDIRAALNKTLFQLSDYKLNRSQHGYTQTMLYNSKPYRLEIIKGLMDNNLVQLHEHLILVQQVTFDMIMQIEQEYKDRDQKQELISK